MDDTWEFVLPGPDLATPHYRPASTAGDEGEACVGATKCIHGTTVAYIAAGRDPEGVAPDGIAPGAQVLAIQVASIFPASHCKGRRSPCAKFLPLDVLRALHHVRHLLDASPDAFGNTELVAVNMSVQVERWCDAWSYELGWSTCGGKQVAGHWVHASYVEPCENAFSRLVDSLLARNVHTVIASGNRGARNEPDRGVVSLPGCVESAVTVGATAGPPHYRRLWSGTMIGPTVDLLAPGQAILTAPYPSDVHGTSYAAPVVSGVLARMRQALRPCGDTDPGVELARLLQENAPISFAGLNVPASVDNTLGLDLAPVPLSCPP